VFVRSTAVREKFPHGHAERPHVALVREDSVLDALERQPLDRHLAARRFVLVLVDVQQLGQTEIGDFHAVGRLDQHVPRRQVAVHEALLLQVRHS